MARGAVVRVIWLGVWVMRRRSPRLPSGLRWLIWIRVCWSLNQRVCGAMGAVGWWSCWLFCCHFGAMVWLSRRERAPRKRARMRAGVAMRRGDCPLFWAMVSSFWLASCPSPRMAPMSTAAGRNCWRRSGSWRRWVRMSRRGGRCSSCPAL